MASTSSALLLLMLVTCSLVIIACSAQQFYASGRYGKRGSSTFWSGSRYGRSGGGIGRRQQSGGGSPVEVSARNDRFFIGSRYGKRSDETVPSAEPGINGMSINGKEVWIPETVFR
ncbi:hypothetical protein C0J52_00916 [Blattella germanica]|nr:hypothetical protein C0J52_00916 [Blattella germanica]